MSVLPMPGEEGDFGFWVFWLFITFPLISFFSYVFISSFIPLLVSHLTQALCWEMRAPLCPLGDLM